VSDPPFLTSGGEGDHSLSSSSRTGELYRKEQWVFAFITKEKSSSSRKGGERVSFSRKLKRKERIARFVALEARGAQTQGVRLVLDANPIRRGVE